MANGWWIGIVASLAGTTLGALGSWFITTRNLKLSDHLARKREQERDDRQQFRALLLARYEKQRRAIRSYAEILECRAEDEKKQHYELEGLLLDGFEHFDLAVAALDALARVMSETSVAATGEARAYLATLVALAAETRKQVNLPPIPDWRAEHQKSVAAGELEVLALLRRIGLDMDEPGKRPASPE